MGRRILGVDPGTRVVGWGLIEANGTRHSLLEYGVIAPDTTLPLSRRLAIIYRELDALYERLTPDDTATEEIFHGKSARSAIRIGEGRGVVLLCAGLHHSPVSEYAANEIKKAVAGRGGASKEQVAEMVALLLGLPAPPRPHDASDALAIALTHASRQHTRMILGDPEGGRT